MSVLRMDNVAIVVADLDAAIAFFTELGLQLEARAMIEGRFAARPVGHHRGARRAGRLNSPLVVRRDVGSSPSRRARVTRRSLRRAPGTT